MIAGVIFDMDGLMTDTERLFLHFWCEVMTQRGFGEHRDVVSHCIGLNHAATRAYVRDRLGENFDYTSVMMEVGARSREYCMECGVPVKPGLYELLDYLDEAKLPYAVATSTLHDGAVARLESIKVLGRLSGLVTGDMVSVGKPEPEIFERAASSLHLLPCECMVLEDSPHGILAAYKAGCKPVMIPDLQQPNEKTRPLLFAETDRLDHVIPIIERENT